MKRPINRVDRYEGTDPYPSLSDHRAARRRFLTGSAALLGGGVLAACTRPFGIGGGEDNAPGGVEEPAYHQVRFPALGELGAWLIDGGYAAFHVSALTYHEDCYHFALDTQEALDRAMTDEIATFTYDELVTASQAILDTVRAACRDRLDEAYNEDTGDSATGWFVEVEVVFARLDAPEILGGVAGSVPSYPE